jgi:hypothetical protein
MTSTIIANSWSLVEVEAVEACEGNNVLICATSVFENLSAEIIA